MGSVWLLSQPKKPQSVCMQHVATNLVIENVHAHATDIDSTSPSVLLLYFNALYMHTLMQELTCHWT